MPVFRWPVATLKSFEVKMCAAILLFWLQIKWHFKFLKRYSTCLLLKALQIKTWNWLKSWKKEISIKINLFTVWQHMLMWRHGKLQQTLLLLWQWISLQTSPGFGHIGSLCRPKASKCDCEVRRIANLKEFHICLNLYVQRFFFLFYCIVKSCTHNLHIKLF